MILMGVHPAVRHQAHQVASPAGAPCGGNQLFERGPVGQAAVMYRGPDARQLLAHDTPGADVEVADFGVAHLAVRKAHIVSVGAQEGVRTGLP